MVTQAVRVLTIVLAGTACYDMCERMYVLDRSSCNLDNTQCITNAAVKFEMCEENCSQQGD